jgi:hypothetical protein
MHIYQAELRTFEENSLEELIRILSVPLHDCSGSAIFSALTAGPRIITTSIVAAIAKTRPTMKTILKAEGLG